MVLCIFKTEWFYRNRPIRPPLHPQETIERTLSLNKPYAKIRFLGDSALRPRSKKKACFLCVEEWRIASVPKCLKFLALGRRPVS